ncbi:NADPH-dependent FMN reductase [Aeromicrobium sp. Sec7.5]|uniref:NADPH-dependent FMN reductase n=1 Tax=Aeromicrobium sp. Sec7.5 TaxID=3121276 RepID=UPI002FE48E8C
MTTPTPARSDRSTDPTGTRRRVLVISSSVRAERIGPAIAHWVVAALDAVEGVELDLIDLAEITLPDDALLSPGGGPRSEVADRIEAAEAFVFVTPEYNHSYPASVKRLIDWHYGQWMFKPATVVAYGVQGGHAAIEHLRGVFAELHMVTTRRCLGLAVPWNAFDDADQYVPDDSTAQALRGALAELDWWAGVLTDARIHRPFTT